MEIFSWEVVVDGFTHLQWPDRLVKQKKTIVDGSDRERRHLAGVLTFPVRTTRRLEAGAPGKSP
jgi:hypothetical protein